MIAQRVAESLAYHVKLSVEGIDHMVLNVYVPRLTKVGSRESRYWKGTLTKLIGLSRRSSWSLFCASRGSRSRRTMPDYSCAAASKSGLAFTVKRELWITNLPGTISKLTLAAVVGVWHVGRQQ